MAIFRAVELQAAQTDSMQPDKVLNYADACSVQTASDYIYHTYLKHDLSVIPAGYRVISAKLRLYECSKNDNGDLGTTNIARATADWDEDTICWNNKPAVDGRYLAEDVPPPGVGNWSDWDITTLVKEWVGGTYPNYGLMILNNNEGAYRYNWAFYNRKYESDDGTSYATYIEIDAIDPESPEYRITESRMRDLADQARRLSGTVEELSVSQIFSILLSLKIGDDEDVATTWTKLWENASPNSEFAAQNISFADGVGLYDAYVVVFAYDYSYRFFLTSLIDTHATGGSFYGCVHFPKGDGITNDVSRYFNLWASGTGGAFKAPYSAGSATGNRYCVPYVIYGITW